MRNPVRRNPAATDTDNDDLDEAQRAPEAGGTPGIPTTDSGAQVNPTTAITRAADKIVSDVRDPKSEAAPQPRQYELLNTCTVMYGNFQYRMNAGKILSEHTHDIPALRRQGARLQELQPEATA